MIQIGRGLVTLLVAWVALALPRLAHADYSYSVKSPAQSLNVGGGETQSTVVPPGLKSQCPKGRFLVTNDLIRPPQVGTVTGRDLDLSGAADVKPTFGAVPDSANYYFGTNDHDIVTLANGDVLLIWGVHSKAPLLPKPAWFDFTYKGTFGPGVRRGMMTWRSVDCGQTFSYVSQIDVATLGDGSCAMPQPAGSTVPAGTATQPNYSNGGVDGQLVKVDLTTGDVYMMVQCVGLKQDKSKPGFILSSTPVNETFVIRSTDSGTSWKTLGTLPSKAWRFGIAPLAQGKLAFARYDLLSLAGKPVNGAYTLPTTEQQAPTAAGWNPNPTSNPNIGTAKIVNANVWAHTVVTRVPGSQNVLVTYPATLACGNGKLCAGYAQYVYDPAAASFSEVGPILPSNHGPDGFVMHLAAIDNGTGPILFYWYDVDAATKVARIVGRAVFANEQYSSDFPVALDSATTAHTFNVVPGSNYWFGDYKTAGGYAPHGIVNTTDQLFDYFPLWDEPNGTVHFSHVVIEQKIGVSLGFKKLNVVLIPKPKIGPPPVEMARHVLTAAERSLVDQQERDEGISVQARVAPPRVNTPTPNAKPTIELRPQAPAR